MQFQIKNNLEQIKITYQFFKRKRAIATAIHSKEGES